METKIERLRKALTQAAMEVASDGSDNIKNYEIAFQDAIESIYPDEPWWKILGYWDIFDAMFFGGKTAKEMIDEIVNHVLPKYRDDGKGAPTEEKKVEEDVTSDSSVDYASLFKKLLDASGNETTGPTGNEPVDVNDEGFKLSSQVSSIKVHFDKATGKWSVHQTWDAEDGEDYDFASEEEKNAYMAGESDHEGEGWESLIDLLVDDSITGTWFIDVTQEDIDSIKQAGKKLSECTSTITEADKKPVLEVRREELKKLNVFIDKNGLDYLFSHPFEQFEKQFPAMASSLKKYYNGWEGNSRRPIPFADWWKDLDEKYWKGFVFYAISGASGLTANDAYKRVNGRYEPNEDGSPDITDTNKEDELLKEAVKDKKK